MNDENLRDTSPGSSDSPAGVQSVLLTLKVLEALASSEQPRGVTELAVQLGVKKSRIFRHLRTLASVGYVEQETQTDRYLSGPAFRRLSFALSNIDRLIDASGPIMQELSDRWGYMVVLSLVAFDGIRVVNTTSTPHPVFEISVKVGFELPLHATAQGKLLLAYGGKIFWDRIASQPLTALTPYTICDLAQLREEVALIRERGWAASPNEFMIGTNAIAAPIFRAGEGLIGTIGMFEPINTAPNVLHQDYVEEVVKASSRIASLIA